MKTVENTHLCGSVYGDAHCEHLLYVQERGMKRGKKELRIYNAYCLAEGRCRSLGNIATFTGNSPTWCPKRRAHEQKRGVRQ